MFARAPKDYGHAKNFYISPKKPFTGGKSKVGYVRVRQERRTPDGFEEQRINSLFSSRDRRNAGTFPLTSKQQSD